MKRGRVTIPTADDFVEGTKKYIEKWGADAVRDCDGTALPENVAELAEKVYKTYFLVRSDNEYAYSHEEELQNIALISERKTAFSDTLTIDLYEGYFPEQIKVNTFEHRKYWQVFDRTAGKEVSDWEYVGEGRVVVKNALLMHEYTVNFFAKSLWNATQIYNYTCNGWTCEKDRDIDPIYPKALTRIMGNLENWLKNNPQVNVVRFTTFFYHFFLMYERGDKDKLFNWFNYAMSASPAMFELFKDEYGYEIKLEDLICGGNYSDMFSIPSKANRDYTDLVQRFVSKTLRPIVELVHRYGKEAMMFWGDNWIGAEPYGKYFSSIGLDAIVGSVSSGVNVRVVSEIEGVKYKEIRLMPYFFPDSLADRKIAVFALKSHWVEERRALMRKPVDRIGFGGYLSLADKNAEFCDEVEKICNEFRTIYDVINDKKPYSSLRVAVLSYWGKEKSWMLHNVCQDAPYQKTMPYIGVLEAMCGLPLEVGFIDFDDVKSGALGGYDVVMNYGIGGTAFTGDYYWKDEKVVENVRKFVAGGGGFVGLGEPTSCEYQGKYFQLSDVMGVEEELGKTITFRKRSGGKNLDHFIMRDVTGDIDFAQGPINVYALGGATVLWSESGANENVGVWFDHVRIAVNEYGKGRSFYMSGMSKNSDSTRLLYRALLWAAGKEDTLKKAFSEDVHTECHYYPAVKTYAVINNCDREIKTVFYDIDGKKSEVTVSPYGIEWIIRGEDTEIK